jgi:phosphopentomutase
MKYVGQTGRPFRVRFQEHFRDYKYANNKSKFAAHLLENKLSIGHIDDIMDVLHITNKGHFMDTMEKFHICKETCKNNQINDKNTIKSNIKFEVIVRQDTDRGLTAP